MDESADQRRHRSQDAPTGERLAGLRRWTARVRTLGGRWWTSLGAVLSLLVHSVRQAGRYYRRGDGQERPARSLRTLPKAGSHAFESPQPRSTPADETPPQLAETATGSSARQLPDPNADRRRLPAGDGRLQVECTAERMILSDPDEDDAFLESTVWVDVEE